MDDKQKEDAIINLIFKHPAFNGTGIKEILDLKREIDALYKRDCRECKNYQNCDKTCNYEGADK